MRDGKKREISSSTACCRLKRTRRGTSRLRDWLIMIQKRISPPKGMARKISTAGVMICGIAIHASMRNRLVKSRSERRG